MFGIKKKDNGKELPDLRSAPPSMRDYQRPQLPPIQPMVEDEEIHGLPSFPDSPMRQGFSQSMIKNAVDTEDQNFGEMKEWSPSMPLNSSSQNIGSIIPKSPRAIEMEEWSPPVNTNSPSAEPLLPPAPKEMPRGKSDPNRPVFIRMDKFKESRESLTKIAEKLDQMDELLKMLKEVKTKEEQELMSWEKDIDNIKARINFVNREIFENAY